MEIKCIYYYVVFTVDTDHGREQIGLRSVSEIRIL